VGGGVNLKGLEGCSNSFFWSLEVVFFVKGKWKYCWVVDFSPSFSLLLWVFCWLSFLGAFWGSCGGSFSYLLMCMLWGFSVGFPPNPYVVSFEGYLIHSCIFPLCFMIRRTSEDFYGYFLILSVQFGMWCKSFVIMVMREVPSRHQPQIKSRVLLSLRALSFSSLYVLWDREITCV